MERMTPAFYVRESGEVHTTGVYITAVDDSNIRTQLKAEICRIENEDDIQIVLQADHWTIHIKGRFTPIGKVYVLAMLDPVWQP